jgi:hypothetical protein
MADDPKDAARPVPKITKSAARLKAERVESAREMLSKGYAPDQVISWLETESPGKTWKVGRSTARGYVDRALETQDGEVAQPKNRKQARTRAMLTMMFQRAASLALDDKNVARAPQLINAAIAAADKIARIDGSYAFDASSMLPPSINPATAEEAIRIVAHAQATIDLARRRGALIAKTAAPPVIETTAVETDGDEDDSTDADDAN